MISLHAKEVVFIEFELLVSILVMSSWGGLVRFIMRCKSKPTVEDVYKCFAQIVVSCFTGFLLSIVFIEMDMGFNMILMTSGIGGVLGGPLLILAGDRVKKLAGTFTLAQR
jgi:hypothetical protein